MASELAVVNSLLCPEWPAPACIRAAVTLRQPGVSSGPWAQRNLGDHCGDRPDSVAQNRLELCLQLGLPMAPLWLNQVHGTNVVCADETLMNIAPTADASFSTEVGRACAVLTADCLPVLFCSLDGQWVAAAHAGWRGLAAGVLEATLASFPGKKSELLAWLGPAIGPQSFEVGEDVYAVFTLQDPEARAAFKEQPGTKFKADLYTLARQRLNKAGLTAIYGGGFCTYSEPDRFYSYRRDGVTGRMASLVWIMN